MVGQNIMALRQELNLSLNDFAESVGVSPGFLGLMKETAEE